MSPPKPPLIARQRKAWKSRKKDNELPHNQQDYCGHKLRKKHKHTFRVLLCNPNGLTSLDNTNKLDRLKDKSLAYELDALCITEQNQNLRRIPGNLQLRNASRGWWQHHRVTQAYNSHFDSGTCHQVGGVSIVVNDTLAHRSHSCENDNTGLGRWTSTIIQGKKGFLTRLVCAYRPCKSSGPDTVYMQHVQYFHRINRRGDPRTLFMEDLAQQIISWQHNGEKIILVEILMWAIKPHRPI